jgi:hypothetical protein
MSDRVDVALRDLGRARRRLRGEQGRIARRNARRGFLGAMKALRNALDSEYPRERTPAQEEERYVVEVFEAVARVGRKLFHDRWRVLRPADFRLDKINYTSAVPKRFLTMPKYKLRTAIRFAAWCKAAFPQQVFRLRKVGTANTIAADVL